MVHLEDDRGLSGQLVLFVALTEGVLTTLCVTPIRQALRGDLSPRHIPDLIIEAPSIPRTLTQKKMEIPVKRILAGVPSDQAVSRGSMVNPESLAFFEDLAKAGAIHARYASEESS